MANVSYLSANNLVVAKNDPSYQSIEGVIYTKDGKLIVKDGKVGCEVFVYDVLGQVVKSFIIENALETVQLGTTSSLYLVKIVDGADCIVKKIGNMPIIIWDIDTLDWKYHNSKRIASRVINKVKDGDIILMHDIYSATANSLNIIIPELQNRGYTFVTIPELFYYKEITLEKGMVYGYAR